jgi:hypothetical protein
VPLEIKRRSKVLSSTRSRKETPAKKRPMTSMVNTAVIEVGFNDRQVLRNFFIIQAPGDSTLKIGDGG